MATKTQQKPKDKKAPVAKKADVKTQKKYCSDGISMKNFLILWFCITVLILLFVVAIAFMITLMK